MKKFDILLVEDDQVLASLIRESLEQREFILHLAKDGVEGWSMYRSIKPDICVVDVLMPRKDGYTLVSEIRLVDEQVPIIFLSARTQIGDVLKGLELGADDYLRKPFSLEELYLRLKGLVKRRIQPPDTSAMREYRVGSYRFRHQFRELLHGSAVISLSEQEADLLLLLVKQKNELLERRVALLKLWGGYDHSNSRSMDVFITRLRKLLMADPAIKIMNVRGRGFILKYDQVSESNL
ncbi:DNA-binding response OmpR family regulator [Mucilaginibacter sp. SG538B]|uniref:response regulator transcription factor n=1 Tax=Mucilaginibacter sp. SG538B TaxID=2587021 RepID=UPI00159E758F|nr:response regulator transcription factor [Mucilaginibacter sp. SG538B]NVM66713.1 DNA-binding response OmpR family regulator [Mucilaginibacter sp. SG538B]